MFRKKLFTAIALTAVVSAILAFAIPADAKNGQISASDSETKTLEHIEENADYTDADSLEGSESVSLLSEKKLPAAGVAAALKDGTEYQTYSEHIQSILDEKAAEEIEGIQLGSLTVCVSDKTEEDLPEAEECSDFSPECNSNPTGMPASDIEAKATAESLTVLNSNAACIAYDYIHLRKEASPTSDPIGVFYKNAAATIIGEEGDWYLIESGNITGYVQKQYCAIGTEAKEIISDTTTTTATVDSENLALRMAPDMSSATIEILPKEEILNVVQKFGDWAYVETADGENGFVYAPYLTIESQILTALSNDEVDEQEREQIRKEQEEHALQSVVYSAANGLPTHFVGQNEGNEKGRKLIEFALQFVGNPYVMGGSSLTEGADCSGFVMAVYEEFGFHLTHSTEIDQTEGVAVESIETAEPGDIICYDGHVALYMGDGLIVHAAGAAKGIRIAPACYTDIITIRRLFVED